MSTGSVEWPCSALRPCRRTHSHFALTTSSVAASSRNFTSTGQPARVPAGTNLRFEIRGPCADGSAMSTRGAHPARPIDSTTVGHSRPHASIERITISSCSCWTTDIGMAARPARPTVSPRAGADRVKAAVDPAAHERGALDGGGSAGRRRQTGTGRERTVVDGRDQLADDDEGALVFERMRVRDTDAGRHEEDDVVVVAVVPQPADPVRVRGACVGEDAQREHRADDEEEDRPPQRHLILPSIAAARCQGSAGLHYADETSGAWAIRPPMPRPDFVDRRLA